MDISKSPPKESAGASPGASPVGSPSDKKASKSPVGSPGNDRASKSPAASPVASPGNDRTSESPVPTAGNLLPAEYWTDNPLTEDEDGGLEDAASSTASISSSVMHYRTVQGRTYHSSRGDAEYWNSNDEKQNDALDLLHHAHTMILDGELCLVPLKDDIQKVVDVGTGTGSWAIDFADAYPNTEVIGIDISPIQPSWTPPNLKFEIDDCGLPWTFAPDSIDFVHIRYMAGSIKDWPFLFREAYRCTKPGGWLQSFDANGIVDSDDGTVKPNSAIQQWGEFFIEGGKALGRPFTLLDDDIQRLGMEAAGFVDIQSRDVSVPVGTWPKDPHLKQIGACTYRALYDDVEGYMTYMAHLLGWTQQQVIVFCAHLRREFRDQSIHKLYRMRIVWGRKPEV